MKTLSFDQMEQVNAGGWEWLTNAWHAICDFCADAWNWLVEHCGFSIKDGYIFFELGF